VGVGRRREEGARTAGGAVGEGSTRPRLQGVQYYYARTHGGGTDPPLSGGAPALNALLISSPVDPRPASLSLDRSASSASACCPRRPTSSGPQRMEAGI
jgi:hypothetical protein